MYTMQVGEFWDAVDGIVLRREWSGSAAPVVCLSPPSPRPSLFALRRQMQTSNARQLTGREERAKKVCLPLFAVKQSTTN